MNRLLLILIYFLFQSVIYAQNSDLRKVDALNDSAHKNMRNPPLMKEKVDSALMLATKIGYQNGLAHAHKYKGIYFYFTSNFDSSVYHHQNSLKIFRKINDSLNTAKAFLNIATTYSAAALYDSTTKNAITALKYFDALTDYPGIGRSVNLLGIVHYHQNDYKEALKYFKLYLSNAQTTSDSSEIASGYNNIASVFMELKSYDSSLMYFKEAIRLKEKLGNYNNLGQSYESIGSLYSKKGNSKLALKNYKKAYQLYKDIGDVRFLSASEFNMGNEFKKLDQLDSAEFYLRKAIKNSSEVSARETVKNSRESLADVLYQIGQEKEAYEQLKQAKILSDSILNIEKIEAIAEIETKFETEKKEQQIDIQQAEIDKKTAQNKQRLILIIALLIISILLATILLLFRNRAKKKQKLLVQEKNLKVKEAQIEATLSSQETERKRFAEDLHDGFGQLISALRLNISNFSAKATTENLPAFEHSEKILDEMHKEIRAIAFNLMPVTLIQEGLLAAIKEFASRINKTKQVKIEVSSFELNNRFKEVFEVAIYRIVQEWVNNVLKYASAKKITLQLDQYEDELVLIIEDDGYGFDTNSLFNSSGNGWRNIQTRANLVKGKIEIDSKPSSNGTSFILTSPVSPFVKAEQKVDTVKVN